MIRNVLMGTVLLALVVCNAFEVWAQAPDAAEELQFRTNDAPLTELRATYHNLQDITHVATIRFVDNRVLSTILFAESFGWSPEDGLRSRSGSFPAWIAHPLIATEAAKEASEKQRAYWESATEQARGLAPGLGRSPRAGGLGGPGRPGIGRTPGRGASLFSTPHPDKEGNICFEVPAVSEADACVAAKALLEVLHAHAEKQHQALAECEEKSKAHLAKLEAEAAEQEKPLEELSSQISVIQEARNYRSVSDAQQEIRELRNIVTDLDIRAAGSQEKIAAIKKQQANVRGVMGQGSLLNALDEMLVKETIELAGILASKSAASTVLNEAARFCALQDERGELQSKITDLKKSIDREKATFDKIQEFLVPAEDLLQVVNNEVVVSPVTQAPAPGRRPARGVAPGGLGVGGGLAPGGSR